MRPWYKEKEFWVAAAAMGGFAFFTGAGEFVVAATKDIFTRGRLVSHGTLDSSLGIVINDPESLRAEASGNVGENLSDDAYALARMVRSEGGVRALDTGLLRAHVAMNDLATFRFADTLFGLLTFSNDTKRRGVFGVQYSPAVPPNYPNANARRYATTHDPYEGDVAIALQAISERANGVDRAQGAVKFIDKASMGVQTGSRSFDAVDASWQAEGLQPFTVAEYGDNLVLYRRG